MIQKTAALIEWSDIIKLLIAFATSLLMIWAKSEGERWLRIRVLKRSAWNVAKHHTDFRQFLDDLDATALQAANGRVWISSVDFSEHYSAIISELSKLDSKHSDFYLNYLSAERVVANGYKQLIEMRMHLIKSRKTLPSPPEEDASVKSAISAQCLALKKDLQVMAQYELELLRLIEIRVSDAVNPIRQLENTLAMLDTALKPMA
jgi:hypothetical protein